MPLCSVVKPVSKHASYLHQVNGVNGGDTVLFDVCLCLCACVCVRAVDQSIIAPKWLKLQVLILICMFPGTVQT